MTAESHRESDAPAESASSARILPRDPWGLSGAALLWLAGLAPSLLPRPPVVAMALAGLLAAIGYGAGCAASATARLLVRRPVAGLRRAGGVLAATLWSIAAVMTVVAAGWQRAQLTALGMTGTAAAWWSVLVGGALVGWSLVLVGRALRGVARRISARLGRRVARGLAVVAGAVAAGAVVAVVVGAAYASTWLVFDRIDRAGSGQPPPSSAQRSGGPGSFVEFSSLGAEGQRFVDGGPSVESISRYTGSAAHEPVRVYVGLASAPDVQERARLAVRELQRTGAFDRRLLVVATTTGNGFLDPSLVAAPELLEAGDVATVSMQYSVLPSWLSFLVDQGAAREASAALLAAVDDAVRALPPARRPLVAVSGESLGAFGSQAPFTGMTAAEVAGHVHAAVWVGTPGATELWSTWRDTRSGGPEWQPTIGLATVARDPATATSEEWSAPGWGSRRIALTQHANDPVSWWSPDLVLSRPGWLDEPRGPGVDRRTTWWPLVLFLQTGLDLAAAGAVPPGVGHDYGEVTAQAWAHALAARGAAGGEWDSSDTARLRRALGS